MKYKDAVKISIDKFAKDEKALIIGYNTKFGPEATGTLVDVPDEKIIETPLAENLMGGLSVGLSLVGYKPILYFERFDFILNAIDSIVNHLDKIGNISKGQYKPKVIIRIVIGAKLKPFFTGHCHTQDFTEAMKKLVTFPVLKPLTSQEVIDAYKLAIKSDTSVMVIETKDLYEEDFK